MDTSTLIRLAEEHGVEFRGGFSVTTEDNVPPQSNGEDSASLLLFGQAGPSLWPTFSQSSEFKDGQPHPLDRWSEKVGLRLAESLGGQLLLPFGGPPHQPFVSWAKKAENVYESRLGMLMHPVYGLWHAYRFAISLSTPVLGLGGLLATQNVCDSCAAEPCLSVCPVNAFDGANYDVLACATYLRSNPSCDCRAEGCLARDACPEGKAFRYEQDQRKFHMQQFLLAMMQRDSN